MKTMSRKMLLDQSSCVLEKHTIEIKMHHDISFTSVEVRNLSCKEKDIKFCKAILRKENDY